MLGFENTRKILNNLAGCLAFLELFLFICLGGIWILILNVLLLPIILPFIAVGILYFANGSSKNAPYRKGLLIAITVVNALVIACASSFITDYVKSYYVVGACYLITIIAEYIFEIVEATTKRAKTPKEIIKNNPVSKETWAIRIAGIVALLVIVAFGIFATRKEDEFAELGYFLYVLVLIGMTIVIFGFSRKIHFAGYLTCLAAFSAAFAIFYINQYSAANSTSWASLRSTANIVSVSCLAVAILGLITTIVTCGIIQLKKQLTNKTVNVVEPQC